MASPFLFEHGDRFPVLDLIAKCNFKSSGSVSFDLGTESDSLQFPLDAVPVNLGPGAVFNVIGWVDVHHPCEGYIKARFRVSLPARYLEWQKMKDFVDWMFFALGIPADETFEAWFASVNRQIRLEQATDRNGMTDRLY